MDDKTLKQSSENNETYAEIEKIFASFPMDWEERLKEKRDKSVKEFIDWVNISVSMLTFFFFLYGYLFLLQTKYLPPIYVEYIGMYTFSCSLFLYFRYQPFWVIKWSIVFLKAPSVVRNWLKIAGVSLILSVLALIIAFSSYIFFLGSSSSLGISNSKSLSDFSPFLVFPAFLLGVTLLGMIIQGSIEYLDYIFKTSWDTEAENLENVIQSKPEIVFEKNGFMWQSYLELGFEEKHLAVIKEWLEEE
jgi:hypothetical protein